MQTMESMKPRIENDKKVDIALMPRVVYPHTKLTNSSGLATNGNFESSQYGDSSGNSGFGVGVNSEEYKNTKFVGAEKCRLCHSIEYRKWQKTKHAGAYGDMEIHYEEEKAENKKNKIEKTDCESCHTTGYGYKFGFMDKQISSNLIGVQCEVCHGPGGEHSKNPKQVCMTFGDNPIPEELCRSCHQGDMAQGFEFGSYILRIECNK